MKDAGSHVCRELVAAFDVLSCAHWCFKIIWSWRDSFPIFRTTSNGLWGSANWIMQFYHHPYSLDSQKVRLALEEKGIDYTSHHVNPITGKNMDASFFRKNPSGKLPVFQNGSHIIFDTIEMIQYALSFTLAVLFLLHSIWNLISMRTIMVL